MNRLVRLGKGVKVTGEFGKEPLFKLYNSFSGPLILNHEGLIKGVVKKKNLSNAIQERVLLLGYLGVDFIGLKEYNQDCFVPTDYYASIVGTDYVKDKDCGQKFVGMRRQDDQEIEDGFVKIHVSHLPIKDTIKAIDDAILEWINETDENMRHYLQKMINSDYLYHEYSMRHIAKTMDSDSQIKDLFIKKLY